MRRIKFEGPVKTDEITLEVLVGENQHGQYWVPADALLPIFDDALQQEYASAKFRSKIQKIIENDSYQAGE